MPLDTLSQCTESLAQTMLNSRIKLACKSRMSNGGPLPRSIGRAALAA